MKSAARRSSTLHRTGPAARRLISLLLITILTAACAAGGGYWIPPSSPPTVAAQPGGSQIVAAPVVSPPPTLAAGATNTSDLAATIVAAVEATATPTALILTESASTVQPLQSVDPQRLTPAAPTATPEIYVVNSAPILYYAQAADTLRVVAVRYGVLPDEITSPDPIPETAFINPGQLLIIPRRLTNTTASQHLLPDSEVVYSPSAVSFDTLEYTRQAGGYLSSYREWHKSTGMKTGAEIVERVAIENAINPRLLLALLEYHSGWVFGLPQTQIGIDYPMGLELPNAKGLYNQLIWAVNQISVGYYAYREGRLTELRFSDGVTARLAPDMNAGTAALQYYFAQLYSGQRWLDALDAASGLPGLHATLFGNPWERAQTVEPLYPADITQPPLNLPFTRDWTWSYTGGPHGAWEQEGAYAALDFAPGSTEASCNISLAWVTAASAGLVVRTGPGLVVLDLDGDGHEQTGWVLVYLHVAAEGRVQVGDWVAAGDPLGHPSCEGGFATGTHIHLARKFNGEWVPADGPLPFNLGGWVAHNGPLPYKGTLTRGDVTLTACTCSNYLTFITRTENDP